MKLFKVKNFIVEGSTKLFNEEFYVLAESEEQIKECFRRFDNKQNATLIDEGFINFSCITEFKECDVIKIGKLNSDQTVEFKSLNLKQVIENVTS